MSKNDVIIIMNNSDLIDKMGVLYIYFFIIYKKWVIKLNELREQARDKYRSLSEDSVNGSECDLLTESIVL